MKTIYIIFLFIASCLNVYSQRTAHNKSNKAKTTKNNLKSKTFYKQSSAVDTVVQPRITVTEKYLKGSSVRNVNADTSDGKSSGKNAFVGGIQVAPDAGEKFDTVNNSLSTNNVNTANVTITPIAAPNDTIFNNNTVSDNSVNTNSGAVDRSGQAQFGQTNWGNSRSTVGESQWTIPPPVTVSFNKEFPAATNTTWSRNNNDTAIYSARYKSGDMWITTNYSASGQRLDIRSEVPLASLPRAVSTYVSKLPTNLQVTTISKWQVLGKAVVYEIQTRAGKTFYVNNEGVEVNY